MLDGASVGERLASGGGRSALSESSSAAGSSEATWRASNDAKADVHNALELLFSGILNQRSETTSGDNSDPVGRTSKPSSSHADTVLAGLLGDVAPDEVPEEIPDFSDESEGSDVSVSSQLSLRA